MRSPAWILIAITISFSSSSCSVVDQQDAEIRRGICVILGDSGSTRALELARETEMLIYVQLENGENLDVVRRTVDREGYYGNRIWVDAGSLDHINLGDNLADLILADQDAASRLSEDEVLRVLCPLGIARIGATKLTKPIPEGADDWTHPFHGPDNNPQSNDQIARAPYLTQFLAKPYYAPLTQVAVASSGRVFKAFGNIAFHVREEPLLNSLVAFNGFNGTMLWRRRLTPGVMIHRNTMVATPDVLYVGDDKSCKRIDTVTGRLIDEITPPVEVAGGTFWKWMAIEDGILYAMTGEQEQKDPVVRQRRKSHGWPWDPLSRGFNQPDNPWGYGKDILAIDIESKRILWSHHVHEEIDGRAICMSNGQIFIYRHGAFLTSLNASDGSVAWRRTPANDSGLFEALGPYSTRQDWRTNWRTAAYLKSSEKALYFAGPTVEKLLAVSAEDGSVLWEHPYGNFQLVIRDDGLYGISGQIDEHPSLKFDAMTGKVLAELDTMRRGCTRPNGSVDALFYRAQGGSVRFDIASQKPQWISPMRAQCHDSVTVANGLLYWWPSTCDCQNTLYGLTCLGPAGDFEFNRDANGADRLVVAAQDVTRVEALPESPDDWPTFRANNIGTSTTDAQISAETSRLWWFNPETDYTPTPPVTAGGLVFVGGSDGVVRALDSRTGDLRWKAYTGGLIRFPPTFWKSRLFVGSGDGWVYAYEAATGNLLWRFRAAPEERRIPVYDSIMSTWPVASGVLVEEGVAYAAAGIVNYDGIHVYALDAVTGEIKWQNNSSGHLNPEARTGVSVQGHLLLDQGKLYLAGGTSVSPAIYDAVTGECLNDVEPLQQVGSMAIRGRELYKVGDQVVAAGMPLYGHPDFPVYDPSVYKRTLHTSSRGRDVIWQNSSRISCFTPLSRAVLNRSVSSPPTEPAYVIDGWGELDVPGQPLWAVDTTGGVAFVRARNAVLIAGVRPGQEMSSILPESHGVEALDVRTGERFWDSGIRLQAPPVDWGIAIDSAGRVVVAMKGGRVMCFGAEG
jgi:outer membrane protein assembly factor BamB